MFLVRIKELPAWNSSINTLIKEIQRSPFEGIGKLEPLKHALSGFWSRRINDEHRIVYKVTDNTIMMAQLRYHD
jgi:toxin YoeB